MGPKYVDPAAKPDGNWVELPAEPISFVPLNWWQPVQATPSPPPVELSSGRLADVDTVAAVGEWQLMQKRSGSGLGCPAKETDVTSSFCTTVVGEVSARECIDWDHCW